MNPESEDNRIKDLFLELRREDTNRAPSFARMWSAAAAGQQRRQHGRGYFRRMAAVAASLALLGAAASLMFDHHRSLPTKWTAELELPWKSEVLISHWRAPTDFLLERPWPVKNQRNVENDE
jgi:hypothetical protein